jgi:hypothetical protein
MEGASKKNIDFQNEVLNLIHKNLKTYEVNTDRIISDYRAEKEYTKAYNGRQLLELLQNADDARTDKVLIVLDTSKQELTISNNGDPFSVDGIRSLMLANLSSKNKKEFIGNKGLGFRSILNWVDKVEVITPSIILAFSPKIAQREYEKIFQESEELQKTIAKDKNLEKGEIPFAILAIPDYFDNNHPSKWETEIKLQYKKEEEANILEQLSTIRGEILLFLKHTQEIEIEGAGTLNKKLEREKLNESKIAVNDTVWFIYDSGELEFGKNKFYNFKVAWQEGLVDKDASFFTYFPTQVRTHLPCLIHATFELDPARNYINNSKANRTVLSSIANKLGEIAVHQLKIQSTSNWDAYRLLTPEGTNDNKLLVDFYESIAQLRDTLGIYPCVDGNYSIKKDAYYSGDEFSQWVVRNNFGSYFPQLLLPSNDTVSSDIEEYEWNVYSAEHLLEIFIEVSPLISSEQERSKLIKLLTGTSFRGLRESNIQLPLLLDKDGKVVQAERQVFTIRQKDTSTYMIPDFVTISFISQTLFDTLVLDLANDIETIRIKEEDRSRPLKRLIDKIVNIGSNDIIDVIRYIVSDTKKQIEQGAEAKEDLIYELNQSLFTIFKVNPDRKGTLPIKVPTLNRKLNIRDCDSLFLSKEYQSGKLTELIFEGIYSENDYVAGNDFWELEVDSEEELEQFFTWLGVNKRIKIKKDEEESIADPEYIEYVFSKVRKPDKITRLNFRGISIANEIVIKQLSAEKLILLIEKEIQIKSQLDFENKDLLSVKYGSGYPKPINLKPSYIEFQLVKNTSFSDYLIEEEIGVNQLFKQIDYSAPIFIENNISPLQIKFILKKLGAVESLMDISLEQFYTLFDEQETNFPNGKGSQAFYKKFLEYCTKNKEVSSTGNTHDFTDLKCFARKGGKGSEFQLVSVDQVYYSDNTIAPQNVLDNYWILNLPKRLGEQNVKKYFGVNLIQEELKKISIRKENTSLLNNELNAYLKKLHPYILCYRLSTLTKQSEEKKETGLLKNLSIKLVMSCSYSFNDSSTLELEENAFITIGSTFYLKSSLADNIHSLQKTPPFCDAIAEILCIQFKVKEHKNNFRAIFKDHITETEHLINTDELDSYLQQAKKLLGISREEFIFWNNLYKTQDKVLPKEIHDTKKLEQCLFNDLSYQLPENYILVDLNDLSKNESFQFLQKITDDFSVELPTLITWESEGLLSFYTQQLKNTQLDHKVLFEQLLWIQLSMKKERQRDFLKIQNQYNSFIKSPFVQDALNKNFLNLNWDTKSFFNQALETSFGINLSTEIEDVSIENKYQALLNENGLEEGDIEDLSVRSLLFFENNETIIRGELVSLKKEIEKEEKEINTEEIGKLNFSSSIKHNISPSTGKKKGSWSHGLKDVRKNKRAGKRAEQLVFNTLKKEFGAKNVRWVSGFSNTPDKSDESHYDIRYKSPSNNSWKFVEVKAFNGTYFHLSREEKRYAQETNQDFEIALVMDNEIHIFRDLFNENINFENNDLFRATPSDYIISLKIDGK